jgi:large subunit ribosomal protein L5
MAEKKDTKKKAPAKKAPAKKAAKKAPAKKKAAAKKAAKKEDEAPVEIPTPRLWTKYQDEIRASLQESFGYKNPMAVPRLEKIVISMGIGKALKEPKRLEEAQKHLTQISGQKAVITQARKSVSNFRLREGNPIGCKVTLRRQRMYEFLDRLVSVAIPRIRDFRGFNDRSFDGRGNYSMGLNEQTVFVEVDADRMAFTQGMNITFITSAKSDKEAFELMKGFGFPFRKPS